MEKKNKSGQFIIIIIILLLILVMIAYISLYISSQKKNDEINNSVKFQQLYSSDYDIVPINDNYYLGLYENKINVIINSEGQEVYQTEQDIEFDGYYKINDTKYLFYKYIDGILNTYIFDDYKFIDSYVYNDNNLKPIIYLDSNKEEYIIGFAINKDSNLYLYNLDSKEPIIIENKELVGDIIKDDNIYLYNKDYLVIKNNEGKMGIIDFNGNTIIDCLYDDLSNTVNNTLIAKLNNKYGIIDFNNDILLKFNYNIIYSFKDYYLIGNKYNKIALFNNNFDNKTGFVIKYNDSIMFNLHSDTNIIKAYNINNNIVIVNNTYENIEYSNNIYMYKDSKITEIKNAKFGFDNKISFTYDGSYITIYDNELNEIKKSNYEHLDIKKIKYINNKLLEIIGNDDIKIYDNELNILNFINGDIIYENENYFGLVNNDKFIVYDYEYNELGQIEGNNFIIKNNNIIFDGDIYAITQNN